MAASVATAMHPAAADDATVHVTCPGCRDRTLAPCEDECVPSDGESSSFIRLAVVNVS